MKEEDKVPSIFDVFKWFKFWRETRHATKDIQTDADDFHNIKDEMKWKNYQFERNLTITLQWIGFIVLLGFCYWLFFVKVWFAN